MGVLRKEAVNSATSRAATCVVMVALYIHTTAVALNEPAVGGGATQQQHQNILIDPPVQKQMVKSRRNTGSSLATEKKREKWRQRVSNLCSAGAGRRALIVGAFELGVVPLPRPSDLADVCVDQRGDCLDALVEHADRGHGLAELLGELPDSIEVFSEVVAHVCPSSELWARLFSRPLLCPPAATKNRGQVNFSPGWVRVF